MRGRVHRLDDLTPELLVRAYAAGIFPMAETRDGDTLYWVDPDERGILPMDGFHVSRRLRKTLRRKPFEVRCDSAFDRVIKACAAPAPDREETWINHRIRELYGALHRLGAAHSVECWMEGRLVGGLYGIALGGAFFGESMFSRVPDASKVALVHLMARLRADGFVLVDTQFPTDHLRRFGVVTLPRRVYLARLADALEVTARFQPGPVSDCGMEGFLQSITQTS